jgi:anaerobic magnesium-protoporphyrin IX monomethyl ester cyclase
MKIVLATPVFHTSQSYSGKQRGVRGVLPPLGVGYIAAAAEARGHEIRFLDGCALGISTPELAARMLAEKPDLVGISCLTRFADSARELTQLLKRERPDLPVVLGGAHVTSFPDDILTHWREADILVPGEGEKVFADLADRIAAGEDTHDLSGILYRDENGRTTATPVATPVADLDELLPPARHIYDWSLYRPLPNQARRRPATTLITSRGCPWAKCQFCFQGGRYASPYRRHSPEYIIREITALSRDHGVREILFWDDNFCINRKWVNRFCDLLDESGIDLTWTVLGRVNTVTEEMLTRIAKSGCYSIYYGFESGNRDLLKTVKKGTTPRQMRDAVKWAKKAGLEIRGSFIFGLPGDTPQKAEETIRFACELNADWVVFFPFHLQPGTPIEELALREGTLLPAGAAIHLPSYFPKGYESPEQLAATIKRAYRKYYLRPRYILRALRRARRPSVLRNYFAAFRFWLSLMLTTEKRA